MSFPSSVTGISPDSTHWGILGIAGTSFTPSVKHAEAKVFYVDASDAAANDDNGGEDLAYPLATIQQAVDNAVSGRGDTIYVMPGSYQENVSITKDYITLCGSLPGGYARPDLEGDAGVALTVHAQGFVCQHVRVAAANGFDGVRQQGNGFIYQDCVFDGDGANDFNLLPDLDDDSYTASEGKIVDCLFRSGDKGLMFTNPGPGIEGGVGPTDVKVIGCDFYSHTTNDIDDTDTLGSNDTTFLNCQITNCRFLTVSAAYVYILLTAGGNNTGLISGCVFADADVINTQVVIPAGIIQAGNYDQAGFVVL